MKKLCILLMLLLAMTIGSHRVFAQSVTVTLMPGWNWISVPLMDTLDFETAMGSFTPVVGDIVKSQWGNANYRADGQWRGTISQFYPGYGYMYKSNRAMPVTVTFQMQQPASQVIITTAEPTIITTESAVVGGTVTIGEGNHVFARGICWGMEPTPTIDGNHISNGAEIGVFSDTLTELTPSTTYYVRAYVVTDCGLAYGEEVSFTTFDIGDNDHDYVDLGLPSGLLWATCNLGADIPEDYGDYFAWGETQLKDYYDWSTYQYCNGSYNTLIKYCNNSSYGYNGFTDNLTTLLPEDDAAMANWGAGWRMPTQAEWQELLDNTTDTWTQQNGVNGHLFTASNGNSLFLPAVGYRSSSELYDTGSVGTYWSSSLITNIPDPDFACYFGFYSDNYDMYGGYRDNGHSVRAVRSTPQNTPPTGAIDGKFTINANGDQVYFSQGNLQYQASTNTWRFAESQWDYVGTQYPDSYGAFGGTINGSDNSNISESYNGWIDLFGWGTSGYNHGAICYQPWSTSRNTSDYYVYGDITYNLFDQTGKAEWGYNPISNGGNMENSGWRTLTDDEWTYIMSLRSTISGVLFAKGQVNGHKGVFVFPDDWSSANYAISNTNGGTFSSNIISLDDWINVLEPKGVVFLPAAGMRDGVSVVNVNVCGYYYCSTRTGFGANNVHFNNGYLWTQHSLGRTNGQSVRLVQLVQ